jgi:hypothetical protein
MNSKGWIRILGSIVLTAGWLMSGQLWSQTKLSDGYSLEDFNLRTAADLVDICTLDQSHPDNVAARAFCYGFFEGGIQYAEAISTSPTFIKLVCSPPETTRTEAVDVFVAYVRANPQYASKRPIDTIYRALVAKWPCDE